MNVADVITNEGELMQLGLNLGVYENYIKRMICGKKIYWTISSHFILRLLNMLYVLFNRNQKPCEMPTINGSH